MITKEHALIEKVKRLNEIGIALSVERNIPLLLEKILINAKLLTGADGGTLYTVKQDQTLRFEVTLSDSLGHHLGGSSGKEITYPEVPLWQNSLPNLSNIVTYVYHHKKSVAIEDVYTDKEFDFSGPRQFDKLMNYRTKSIVTVPLINHQARVVGVLQLINALEPLSKQVISFSQEDVQLIESLGSEASVALSNQQLIHELKVLFESFIRVISNAIDEKSPSTGNHSRRVPIICEMLAHAVNDTTSGPYANVRFSESDIYELKLAAELHDCGKITTPVHVMEKHTKLEKIVDRFENIETRIEVLKRDAYIELLEKKLAFCEKREPEVFAELEKNFEKKIAGLNQQLQLLDKCNKNKVAISDEIRKDVNEMATQMWKLKEEIVPFLSADEVENLLIPYGNLTDKERKVIENHVVMTAKMLCEIPFPQDLKKVPEIAGTHHERVDGKGYPLGLKKDEVPLQTRILVIADIFEALSAPDRPYKEPLPLSLIYKIMQDKVEQGHLDGDLLNIFFSKQVPVEYGKRHLSPVQLDV